MMLGKLDIYIKINCGLSCNNFKNQLWMEGR